MATAELKENEVVVTKEFLSDVNVLLVTLTKNAGRCYDIDLAKLNTSLLTLEKLNIK